MSEGPVMGQVPTLLSLPLPFQGDRREQRPHLFPIYSSSRGTPGSRDRLSPGPRWGLWPALLPGRSAPSWPHLCNSPGQRGRGCQPPPRWPPLPPLQRFGMPGREPKHTPPRRPAPSALSTCLCPIARCPARGTESWTLRPCPSTLSHKRGWRLEGPLEQGHFSRAFQLQAHPCREAAGTGEWRGVVEAITEGVDPVNRNFRQQ